MLEMGSMGCVAVLQVSSNEETSHFGGQSLRES